LNVIDAFCTSTPKRQQRDPTAAYWGYQMLETRTNIVFDIAMQFIVPGKYFISVPTWAQMQVTGMFSFIMQWTTGMRTFNTPSGIK
jgi:hypothetical protein